MIICGHCNKQHRADRYPFVSNAAYVQIYVRCCMCGVDAHFECTKDEVFIDDYKEWRQEFCPNYKEG